MRIFLNVKKIRGVKRSCDFLFKKTNSIAKMEFGNMGGTLYKCIGSQKICEQHCDLHCQPLSVIMQKTNIKWMRTIKELKFKSSVKLLVCCCSTVWCVLIKKLSGL